MSLATMIKDMHSKLVGTADMGSYTGSSTGSLGEKLKQIESGLGGGAVTWNAVTAAFQATLNTVTLMGGLRTQTTVTNPGTTPTTVFNVTGSGWLYFLTIAKPATVNAVAAKLRITLDGTQIADANVTASQTGANTGFIVGSYVPDGSAAGTAINLAGPVMIQFKTSLKVEVYYSGTPGGSENITVNHVMGYSA